jgi:hypothetical protein
MNTFGENIYDSIEQIIYEDGLRIDAVDFHPELDTMIVVLNTKAVLNFSISKYPSLSKASKEQLSDYTLIGKGTGIHWVSLDEDLSLKGFLQDELKRSVNSKNAAA